MAFRTLRNPAWVVLPALMLVRADDAQTTTTPKAPGRVVIVAVSVKDKAVHDTSVLHFHRLGSDDALGPFALPTSAEQLRAGDLIETDRGDVSIRLRCGKVTRASVRGPFKFVVLAAQNVDCALQIMGGRVTVQSTKPTNTTGPLGGAGNRKTIYRMDVLTKGDAVKQGVAVFEGSVDLDKSDQRVKLKQGHMLDMSGDLKSKPERISEGIIADTAHTTAALDVSESIIAGQDVSSPEELIAKLERLHAAVLRNPADRENRQRLIEEQSALGLSEEADYNKRLITNGVDPELVKFGMVLYASNDPAVLCADARQAFAKYPDVARDLAKKAMKKMKEGISLPEEDYEFCARIAEGR